MPHVSNKKISEKDFVNIYNQLLSVFDVAGQKRASQKIFQEFLTDTEKVMFAKRLAIICMIIEGISIHYISETLFVSRSTVVRVSLGYEIGKYRFIQSIIKKNKTTVWQVIGNIISHGAESYVGKRRWKRLNEIMDGNKS
ncbi:MAG TPA: hypothetical protein VJG67_00955 [Candidatus Paceibacterota bacterium]